MTRTLKDYKDRMADIGIFIMLLYEGIMANAKSAEVTKI